MRRTILAAFVAAIALAIGFNSAATAAVDGSAQATAKKKAGKKKSCKPKKGKKKAGKSLADSAAKKKGKKKASGCKPKAKKKAKGKAKPPPQKQGPQLPQKPGGSTFGDGVYKDAAQSVTITVTNNGSQATIGFPGGSCLGNAPINVPGPIAQQDSQVKGSGTQSILGGAGSIDWSLSISPSNLSYKFDATTKVQFPDQDPCQSSKNAAGTLVKQ